MTNTISIIRMDRKVLEEGLLISWHYHETPKPSTHLILLLEYVECLYLANLKDYKGGGTFVFIVHDPFLRPNRGEMIINNIVSTLLIKYDKDDTQGI